MRRYIPIFRKWLFLVKKTVCMDWLARSNLMIQRQLNTAKGQVYHIRIHIILMYLYASILIYRCTVLSHYSYPCNAPVIDGICGGKFQHECKDPFICLKATSFMYSTAHTDTITMVESTISTVQFLPPIPIWVVYKLTKKKLHTNKYKRPTDI